MTMYGPHERPTITDSPVPPPWRHATGSMPTEAGDLWLVQWVAKEGSYWCYKGQTVWLSPLQSAVLLMLVVHQGELVTFKSSAWAAWGSYLGYSSDCGISTGIKHIRDKFGRQIDEVIVSLRGLGYRLDA